MTGTRTNKKPAAGTSRATGPTLKSLKEEIAALRKQCIDNSNGHTEAGAALARRLDTIEAYMTAMPDATPQLITAWANDITTINGDLQALKARMSVVETVLFDPKAKGGLSKAYKGMEKAHLRITKLGEALHGDITTMKLALEELQKNGSRGVVSALYAAKVPRERIEEVLGILFEKDVDPNDSAFVAEMFKAFADFKDGTNSRLTDLEGTVTSHSGRLNAIETKTGELTAQVAAFASANGGSRGTPRWGLGLIMGVLAAAAAWAVTYYWTNLTHGWAFFVAPVVGVATFWVVTSFEKEGSATSAFAAAWASARSSKKAPPAPPAPPALPQVNATTQPIPTVSAGASS